MDNKTNDKAFMIYALELFAMALFEISTLPPSESHLSIQIATDALKAGEKAAKETQ